jgi:putative two-component system response regulator
VVIHLAGALKTMPKTIRTSTSHPFSDDAGHPTKTGRERILVVDDEAPIRELLKTGITMAGYECLTAGNTESALSLLAGEKFDVVISDIHMPDGSGIELLTRIKAAYDTGVIIMTGFVEDFAYEEIIGMGANDFIQKPVRIAEFVARLKRVLAERRTLSQRNRAVDELQLNLNKLRRAMDGIVHAMSVAVELRDPYTAGHQQRVSNLACAIARSLGLSEDRIDGLRMASIIHDLGKLTIPAEILCKPGRLSNLEYELIKNHVQAGYDILKRIEFPWPLAEIILQHHERLDGSGYPHGLSGDAIVLEARIIAVSDVFETIASHRPYRPSLGVNKAIDELRLNKGKLYDPLVVETCLELFETRQFSFERSQKKSTPVAEHQLQTL